MNVCPNCGCSPYPDSRGRCSDCNHPPLRRLTLTGASGSLSFGIRTRLGRVLLLKLSPEANYAEKDEQFTVFSKDSEWFILARSGTKNTTLLNSTPLKQESRLAAGDTIELGSAAGPGKKVMSIVVGIVDA